MKFATSNMASDQDQDLVVRYVPYPWIRVLVLIGLATYFWTMPTLLFTGVIDHDVRAWDCYFGRHGSLPWTYNATDHTCCLPDTSQKWVCIDARKTENGWFPYFIAHTCASAAFPLLFMAELPRERGFNVIFTLVVLCELSLPWTIMAMTSLKTWG